MPRVWEQEKVLLIRELSNAIFDINRSEFIVDPFHRCKSLFIEYGLLPKHVEFISYPEELALMKTIVLRTIDPEKAQVLRTLPNNPTEAIYEIVKNKIDALPIKFLYTIVIRYKTLKLFVNSEFMSQDEEWRKEVESELKQYSLGRDVVLIYSKYGWKKEYFCGKPDGEWTNTIDAR